MTNFFIPRRFVRIKVLQNFYAYTITQQAHKKNAIEQVKKDFTFNKFLNEYEQKKQIEKEKSIAVSLFYETIERQFPNEYISYKENNKIEESVRKHIKNYLCILYEDQIFFKNRFKQSKESIYIDLIYTLLLILEWKKLAKKEYISCITEKIFLKKKILDDPLLEELSNHDKWIKSIYKNKISWFEYQDKVQSWYNQFIQPAKIPKAYILDTNNSIIFLEYIVQNIIFKKRPINDFLAMIDLYWDEHKRIVKKILNQVFIMVSKKDFTGFIIFLQNLEIDWVIEESFYNFLCTTVTKNNAIYESMIADNTKKWDSKRILLIDKLVLKLALAELLECKDIPFKVSINEYIEIAKWYGTPKSGAFVNGILEGILKGLHII